MTRALPLLILALLAACSGESSKSELAATNRRLADAADPAVTAALEDPIMTDRDLSDADNSRRVRLVEGPARADYPTRSRENAAIWSALDPLTRGPACESGFARGSAWAGRLPAGFGVYPGAKLIEAAGNDRPQCRSRVVAFSAAAAPDGVVAWYSARATASGYSAQTQSRGVDRVLRGARTGDGASYYLVVSPRGEASEASLITVGG